MITYNAILRTLTCGCFFTNAESRGECPDGEPDKDYDTEYYPVPAEHREVALAYIVHQELDRRDRHDKRGDDADRHYDKLGRCEVEAEFDELQ